MRVLVFGDSVVLGTWDSLGGWVDRLKQHYHKRYIESGGEEKVQIYNLGIGGEGSQKLLFRIENEIQARWDDRWPTAIVIATGTNDSRLLHGTTLQATEDQFRKNLRDILEKCKSYTNKILFVSPNGFREDEVTLKGHIFSNQRLDNYVKIAQQITNEQQVTTCDIFEAMKGKPELFGVDGVHPNSEGYQLLVEHIQPKIEKLLA